MTPKKINFEEAMEQLNEIVEKLDNNELTLDQSVELYQKGMELSKLCDDILKKAEQKITIIGENKDKGAL